MRLIFKLVFKLIFNEENQKCSNVKNSINNKYQKKIFFLFKKKILTVNIIKALKIKSLLNYK